MGAGIVINRVNGVDLKDVIAKIEREHPELKRSRLEHEFGKVIAKGMRHEAAIRSSVDHRKLGDDY